MFFQKFIAPKYPTTSAYITKPNKVIPFKVNSSQNSHTLFRNKYIIIIL